ncbi:MAG: NUDIX domain-containing protein [Chloroflexota bacterium]|nr:NUDIX domain-containing protein [Chloroflexota bacterium]
MIHKTATSAGGIILREIDGQIKIALAQRASMPITWVLPKGHVEAGETLEQTALREIYEETGLNNIQLVAYLGTIPRESTKPNGDIVHKTIHFYLAYALQSSQATAPTDRSFTAVSWFTPNQALDLLPYEEEKAFFKEHLGALFQSK